MTNTTSGLTHRTSAGVGSNGHVGDNEKHAESNGNDNIDASSNHYQQHQINGNGFHATNANGHVNGNDSNGSGSGDVSASSLAAAAAGALPSTMPGPNGTTISVPSLLEIQKKLPADCLRSDATTSLLYCLRSVVFVIGLGVAYYYARSHPLYSSSQYAYYAINALYWFIQGTVFWGIFVLGHDCGHGSFSPSTRLNWIVGNLLHTFILVPYESWRVTHRHHHKNTGHIDNDEIFFPLREKEMHRGVKLAPLLLGTAWFYYLFRGHYPRNVWHLNPNDPLFIKYQSQGRVAWSVLSLSIMALLLYRIAQSVGWWNVTFYYFAPLWVFGTWLVITTFLHHQEENTPWFADGTWNYVKGNLSSIDRSYWPFDGIVHNIGTHQIHHLFPIIPHYKLKKATEAFRAAYPQLVRKSERNFIFAFIDAARIYATQVAVPQKATYWVFGQKS